MKELIELRNEVLYLKNMEQLSIKGELKLLNKLNALELAISVTRCCESDSEQLCDEGNLGKIKKLYTKVGDKWVEYKTE